MPKYNTIEKKEKDAPYRLLLRPELVDELYEKIQQKLVLEKKYLDPEYSGPEYQYALYKCGNQSALPAELLVVG